MRKKIWIDRLQTYLAIRLAVYFLLYQFFVWCILILERSLTQVVGLALGGRLVPYCSFLLVGSAVALGIACIWDCVKVVHRIVGPLYRFRKTIQAITAGEEMDLVRLRNGDFLLEMRDEINEMLIALEQRGAIVLRESATKQNQKQTSAV